MRSKVFHILLFFERFCEKLVNILHQMIEFTSGKNITCNWLKLMAYRRQSFGRPSSYSNRMLWNTPSKEKQSGCARHHQSQRKKHIFAFGRQLDMPISPQGCHREAVWHLAKFVGFKEVQVDPESISSYVRRSLKNFIKLW